MREFLLMPLLISGSLMLARCAPDATGVPPHDNILGSVPEEIRALPRRGHRPVCDDQGPGFARCHAHVVTDDKGAALPFLSAASPAAVSRANLLAAYNLPADGGQGVTVAVVDAYDNPTAESDLAYFRSQSGLPACTTGSGCFKKVNQNGVQSNYPPSNVGWAGEIALDLDAVSLICPNCQILLVEANDAFGSNLAFSVATAASLGASVISNSYGAPDNSSSTQALNRYYTQPGVALFASTGDTGMGASFPATASGVTAVGGTTLVASATAARGWVESAWGVADGGGGGGSGCSVKVPKPTWQTDATCVMRMEADISADADPNTGILVYDSNYSGSGAWYQYGGTSLASPLVAAIYALTGRASADGSLSWRYPAAFYDVTSGVNGSCSGSYYCNAGAGYDGPTGNGTPNGGLLGQTFTLSAVPSSAAVSVNGTTAVTVSTALKAGDASGVALSVKGLPAGVTGTFSQGVVDAGTVSTITLTASASASASIGTYTYTLTGVGASRTATATGSVSVLSDIIWTGVPLNQTLEATGSSGAVASWVAPTAKQGSTPLGVLCAPGAGSTFSLTTSTVTCTAASGADSATRTFTITVVDTTPPVFSLPGNLTREATVASGAVADFTASATDLVDGPVNPVCSPPSGTTLALGAHPVSCAATDARGNVVTGMFTITVADTTAPSLRCPPDVTASAGTSPSAVASYAPAVATDAVSTPVVSYSAASGTAFAVGATTITATAIDSAGNAASCTFKVTVTDAAVTPGSTPALADGPKPAPTSAPRAARRSTFGCSAGGAGGSLSLWVMLVLAVPSLRGLGRRVRAVRVRALCFPAVKTHPSG